MADHDSVPAWASYSIPFILLIITVSRQASHPPPSISAAIKTYDVVPGCAQPSHQISAMCALRCATPCQICKLHAKCIPVRCTGVCWGAARIQEHAQEPHERADNYAAFHCGRHFSILCCAGGADGKHAAPASLLLSVLSLLIRVRREWPCRRLLHEAAFHLRLLSFSSSS